MYKLCSVLYVVHINGHTNTHTYIYKERRGREYTNVLSILYMFSVFTWLVHLFRHCGDQFCHCHQSALLGVTKTIFFFKTLCLASTLS